jgi:hypothetical protein
MKPCSPPRTGTLSSGAYVDIGGLRFSFARRTGRAGGFAPSGVDESLATVVVLCESVDFAGTFDLVVVGFADGGGSLPYEGFAAGRFDVDAKRFDCDMQTRLVCPVFRVLLCQI